MIDKLKNFKTYSQARQDLFALYINDFKPDGYFLDFGCNQPFEGNNSALLESLGWKGILVDYQQSFANFCAAHRKNKVLCLDLVKTNITEMLIENSAPNVIDYISIDLDNDAALSCIQNLNFDKFSVKCITFEHDAYALGGKMRKASREFLLSKGLVIVCKDVTIFNGKQFEDWYVNPNLISENIYKPLMSENIEFDKIFNI
jgi:hypothetical protein